MKRLIRALFITTVWVSTPAAAQGPEPGQPPTVDTVEVTGIAPGRLSPGLRRDIRALEGTPLDADAVQELTDRVGQELPEYIAATREIEIKTTGEEGRIRLIFLVARIRDDAALRTNINSRYTVESVEIDGVDESTLSDEVRKEMNGLVGERLDQKEAARIRGRIARELGSSRRVSRRIERGTVRDHIRLIFEVKRAPWIPFRELPSFFLYHSKQNFSFAVEAPIDSGPNRVTLHGAYNADDLIERFSGFGVGYQNVRVGTDRLGVRVALARYRQKWEPATRLALEDAESVPGTYRSRVSFDASVTVAITPELNFSFGASISELDNETMPDASGMAVFESANAGVASLGFERRWEGEDYRQSFKGSYEARAGAGNIASDFIYSRHFGRALYTFKRDRNRFAGRVEAGRIEGTPPLFERFAIGDSKTLRGWNKFDLTPYGGDRVVAGSLEYGYSVFGLFYDAGAIWNSGELARPRHSVGFGLHGNDPEDDWFIMLAVPIKSTGFSPVFTIGIRMGRGF